MKLTAVLWAVIVLAPMAGAALTLVARGNLARGDLASNLALSVSVAAFATLGALIVRRAGNRIGWIMLGAGGGPGVSRERVPRHGRALLLRRQPPVHCH